MNNGELFQPKPVVTQSVIAQSPASGSLVDSGKSMVKLLSGPNGIMLLIALGGFAAIALLGQGSNSKSQLARGFLAGGPEKAAARKRAKKQLKEKRHNAVTLYVGTPKRNKDGKLRDSGSTLWIPDAQRGTAVCGAPGSGKTFSIINPAVRSAIEMGYPALVYDFKYPDQTELIAAYAVKHGYQVRVFAPGYPESEVCNPLDFLDGPDDALSARQIAMVMNRNFALNANSSEDKFFADAGDQLTQAILMLAKSMPQPDLLMASAILNLSELPKRLQAAKDRGHKDWQMNNWVYMAFSQLLQLQGSEKTVSGVIGTASKVFSRFLSPELVSAFCGKTTLPIDMEGKQLTILGLDRRKREAIAPLTATILHMLVTRNVTRKRSDPLVLAIDELPTLYLPFLTQWLNENRSDGLVTIIGFQNMTQLEKAYTREISRSVLGGCATKAIFNPQDHDSARWFSEYLGEEQISMKQKSRSSGKSGTSTSTSDHVQKRHIVESAQFNKLPTGKCVFINPAYGRKEEESIPLIQRVKIPQKDIDVEAWSKRKWPKLRDRLIAVSGQTFKDEEVSKAQIADRMAIAAEYFPLDGDGGPPLSRPATPVPASQGANPQPDEAISTTVTRAKAGGIPAELVSSALAELKEVF